MLCPSQIDIIGRLTRQPCNNLDNLHESSPPQCQDFDTPILNRNASLNRLEKENTMKIVQNKKINDQLVEIRKSHHKKYMLIWYLLTVLRIKMIL